MNTRRASDVILSSEILWIWLFFVGNKTVLALRSHDNEYIMQ